MNAIWREHRLLLAIGVLTTASALWELSHPDDTESFARERRSVAALAAVYPDEARLRFEQGSAELAAREFSAAARTLAEAYDAGFKEDERIYLGYVEAIMMTAVDADRIAEVMDRWERDYPRSAVRARTLQRLRNSGVLP